MATKYNKIIGEFADANDLTGIIVVADFCDDEKLGKGKDKIDRLSNLIAIFENYLPGTFNRHLQY